MHLRTLFKLLAAVLFMGALYVFVSVRDPSGSGRRDGLLLLDLEPETADHLTVETAGWRVECRKIRGRWRLQAPLQGAADVGVVERLLGELALLPCEETVTPDQMALRGLTLDSYGLAKPEASITVRAGASPPVTLKLGALAPFPNAMFVMRDDEPGVVVTRTNILAALPSESGLFRDRRLLEGEAAAVVRLEVDRRGSPFVQVSREGGEWRLLQPVQDRADRLRLEAVLKELLAVEVRDVVSDANADPAAYGLGPGSVEISLALWLAGEAEPVRVEFGRLPGPAADRLNARIGGLGPVLAVDTNVLGLFAFRVADWRDPYRVRFPPDSVRGFTLETGERRVSCWRGEGGWRLTEPVQAAADPDRIRSFLAAWSSLPSAGFEEAPPPADPPVFQFQAWTGEVATAAPDSQFRLWPAGSDGRHRAEAGAGGTFLLEPEAVRGLLGEAPYWDPFRFRDRTVLAVPTGTVQRVALVRGQAEQVVERDDKGRWISHEGRMVQAEALDALLRAVEGVRAVRLEPAAADLPAHGFEEPFARLELGLVGGAGIQKTVILGAAAADGGRYARVQGQDTVFVLAPETEAVLTRDLLQ